MNGRIADVEEFCDICGTPLVQREDDEAATVERRIEVYNEQTRPLIDYYTNQGLLVELDGMLDVDALGRRIIEALGEA
jgi:adenylate kinase